MATLFTCGRIMATLFMARQRIPWGVLMPGADAVAGLDDLPRPVAGKGKCMVSGCDCPSYVEPPGGFDCKRCRHQFSDHW